MSKERLEEIKRNVNYNGHLDDDVEWLIKQAERVADYEKRYEKHLDIDIRNDHKIQCLEYQIKRYREALEEIMKIQENHEWNLYGIAYGIAERTLFEVEGEE